jgi:hypothetical protein
MAYLLVILTVFQFIFRIAGLQDSTLYLLFNPYVLTLPFIVIWIGSAMIGKSVVDRNLLITWMFLLAFPSVMLRTFNGDSGFFFLFLRGLQFFWGPVLLVPAFLGFFRMWDFTETSDSSIGLYITIMALIAGSLTLFELFAVNILGIPPLTFPWIGAPGGLPSQDLNPFRPWGLPSYPQPNALIMTYLFWLAMAWKTRGIYHKLVTLLGVVLSGSGTGQFGFAAMALLVIRRPVAFVIVVLMPVLIFMTWASMTNQYAVGGAAIGRFDIAYPIRLSYLFAAIAARFINQFSLEEILFGTLHPTAVIVLGYTHDWAYLDIFYAYGVVGLIGYCFLFGGLLYLALPEHISRGLRFYFAVTGLVLNFHYGTLNFFAGQMLFSSIVALRLNGIHARRLGREATAPV